MRKLQRMTPPKHTPTQKEIAAACEAIQANWTPDEEQRRIVGLDCRRMLWTPQVIETNEVGQ